MEFFKERLWSFLEDFDSYASQHDFLRKFELYSLNDDYVFYVIVYLITAISIGLLCVLTNFYQVEHSKKDSESSPHNNQNSS
ncbi:unnamed protein product [Brachionus calyciflorus]|uniref:Uncharacterized protein n=1 Tax=Brachionus calyciflorus TaxID=104777 RepID=A0A813VXB4_9BILA|nr:unnamed protein product [Brachionus calyciflorus]